MISIDIVNGFEVVKEVFPYIKPNGKKEIQVKGDFMKNFIGIEC